MKLKEAQQKRFSRNIKESTPALLDISFTRIIADPQFGLLPSSSQALNDKIKVQKIVKTLMFIREKKPHELIQTPKQQQIGGCEKCVIDDWRWENLELKNHLQSAAQSQVFIIRAGDSRIFGSIYNNCFYIHAIEYAPGDAYKH